MFAVGLIRGERGVHGFEVPEPQLRQPDEVLVRVREVGLDGTDFGMVGHDQKDIAEGRQEIILGHEMLGMVEEMGSEVQSLQKGDMVALTVRRGCGLCPPCLHNQSDMCLTGLYKERGIHKLDGFLTRYVVDQEQYMVKVPPHMSGYGVLTEALSIAEKAIEQIKIIQARLPWACPHPDHAFSSPSWGGCKTALVLGAGPLGFLGTCLLRLAGVEVYVAEQAPKESLRVKMIEELGAKYVSTQGKLPQEVIASLKGMEHLDIIFEAAGAAELALNLLPYTSRGCICVMTGIPRGELKTEVDANHILRQIVRYNQVIVGSVNSNRSHFEMALRDMDGINRRFDNILDKVFTHRFRLEEYKEAFSLQDLNRIKIVIEM